MTLAKIALFYLGAVIGLANAMISGHSWLQLGHIFVAVTCTIFASVTLSRWMARND